MLHIFRKTSALTTVIAAICGCPPAFAAESPQAFSYSHIDLEYDLDATVQLHGGSFDSDSSYSTGISYLVQPNVFVFGSHADANYDLQGTDDLWFTNTSLGVGYRHALNGTTLPMDVFAAVAYERQQTRHEVAGTVSSDSYHGGSLQLGVRAALTPQFEVNLYAQQFNYGNSPFARNQTLDGLFFGVGSMLHISKHAQLTLTYITGELDYQQMPGEPTDSEVELDRDTLRFGFRWNL
jgi:hypothetical protein